MPAAPVYEIDPKAFWNDPYPDLKAMRNEMPLAFVPQLGATLMTRRDDIFINEKKIDIFSSLQPGGLMTRLMGENLMRRDGESHQRERTAIFPTVSPKTVKNVWREQFEHHTSRVLDEIAPWGKADLVTDFAMPVSAEALKAMTGLVNMSAVEMNRVSQGMIDGCANYSGDPAVEARCNDCTASIDRHIDERIAQLAGKTDYSLLSVQQQAGLGLDRIQANIKLAISGGQNEPRDAIAGTAWALMSHPAQLASLLKGEVSWLQAFEEYARWISPVAMSPRRVAKPYEMYGVTLQPEERVFLMFAAANRDERVFERPDEFDLSRDLQKSIPFGAGPHYCAGAWASRCLIADVALPQLFTRLKNLRLDPDAPSSFGGWAFRGPLRVPVLWDT
jgi:cytochrome P450